MKLNSEAWGEGGWRCEPEEEWAPDERVGGGEGQCAKAKEPCGHRQMERRKEKKVGKGGERKTQKRGGRGMEKGKGRKEEGRKEGDRKGGR